MSPITKGADLIQGLQKQTDCGEITVTATSATMQASAQLLIQQLQYHCPLRSSIRLSEDFCSVFCIQHPACLCDCRHWHSSVLTILTWVTASCTLVIPLSVST